MRIFHAILLVALSAACGPPEPNFDPAESKTYLIYDYLPETGEYDLIESEIETLDDPVTLDGEVAYLRGGGSIVTRSTEPETREEWANAFEIQKTHTPSARYLVDDGVVVPFDFHTQMMVTLYHHIERADEFFVDLGLPDEEVGKLPVYYRPQTNVLGFNLPILSDNAAYAYTIDAMIIPPTLFLNDDVPLSANRGVIVHEYSHAVFHRLVHDSVNVPEYVYRDDFSQTTKNQIRSLDEGLADFFAALAVGDPNFISASISSELFDIDRDLEIERVWDAGLQDEVDDSASSAQEQRNPYLIGSVIASTLWSTRDFVDDGVLTTAVLDAMRGVASPGTDFRVSNFFNVLLGTLPEGRRDSACALFTERLAYVADQLECP